MSNETERFFLDTYCTADEITEAAERIRRKTGMISSAALEATYMFPQNPGRSLVIDRINRELGSC